MVLFSNGEAAPAVTPFKSAQRSLRQLGFHPIPLGAGKKAPCIPDWTRFCDEPLSGYNYDVPSICRDSNIGLAMGSPCGEHIVIAIDIDVDEYETIDRLKRALPPAKMSKRGAKGETWFYLASPAVASAQYRRDNGAVLVDLLAHGRQTVVPPSVHPSGCSYKWLIDPVAASELPILDEDHWLEFHEALEACGWNGAVETIRNGAVELTIANNDDADTIWDEINARALADLSSWVPALDLCRSRPKKDGFEAVADWRASSERRVVAERKRNLSIVAAGIVDFGTGQGYSPIDLVMAAKRMPFDAAWLWLHEQTGLRAETDAIVVPIVEAIAARQAAKRLQKATGAKETLESDNKTAHLERAPNTSPFTWDDREANAASALDWLAKKLFLRVGVHLLFGQSASGKSFVALDIARCVASGEPFFGHRIKAPGGVLFALGEGVGSMPRRLEALRIGKLRNNAPVDPSTGEMMDIDRLPFAWMPVDGLSQEVRFREFAVKVRLMAREMPEKRGCPLRLVIIDTVVASFGFKEDPDAAEITDSLKTKLGSLAQELGICIIAVHHAGKTKEAGEYGSYAWRANVESSVEVDAKRNEVGHVRERRLIVRKSRDGGNEGWNQCFDLKSIDLGMDEDNEPIESAIVVPFVFCAATQTTARSASTSLRAGPQRIVTTIETAIAQDNSRSIEVDDGLTVNAVSYDDLKDTYIALNDGEPETIARTFRRDLEMATRELTVMVDDNALYWIRLHANDNEAA